MTFGSDGLGAHVSTAGGVSNAPERGASVGATAIQIFTKTPNQWREPRISEAEVSCFKHEVTRVGLRAVVAHDSYLINLASPDSRLRTKSIRSFTQELLRSKALGVPYVVTHPGNYMDDREAGLERNARAYTECLTEVTGPRIAIETTAGTGTALGARFEELAELRRLVPARLRRRIGFCADTCHLYAAGYDLRDDWDGVWAEWERTLGFERLWVMHLNDSKTPLGSRRDRHEWIAEGTLGPAPFRRVMQEARFAHTVKLIETPKAGEGEFHDRRMLRRLRAYARRKPSVP